MNKPLCIYHGNCADGFTAAWAVRAALGEDSVDFHTGMYGEAPPEVDGRDVILVDFSYKRDVLEAVAAKAESLLILDHHKSAEDDLKGFGYDLMGPLETHEGREVVDSWEGWLAVQEHLKGIGRSPGAPGVVGAEFDMNRSGAGIAWDFFHEDFRPEFVDHIEDRDLWRFHLRNTREIMAAIFSYEYTFENWDAISKMDLESLALDGGAIERKRHKDIRELLSVTRREMEISGYKVPVANLPYTYSSDAGHLMAQDAPFAACYYESSDDIVFSLRSAEGGADVSKVAAMYGGGGHKSAAGFRIPRHLFGQGRSI